MKNLIALRLFLSLLIVSFLGVDKIYAFFDDISLPRITNIKTVIDRDSVGFEWKSVAYNPAITGINVYRAKAKPGINQTYIKIDSISNRFATHYVDTTAQPGTKYFYTFTTYSGLNESSHGDIVAVKTKPPYKPIKVVSATRVDKDVVKLLWVPHSDITIREYVIQRKCRDNRWHYLTTVKGRLYPEYVDTTAPRGYICHYRLFARDASKLNSFVSKVLSVEVK